MANYRKSVGRKGQASGAAISGLLGVALLVLILIVSVTIGSQITQTITENEAPTTNASVINETFNVSQNTLYSFSNRKPVNSVRSVNNGSGVIIDAANYTVDFSAAKLNLSGVTYGGRALNVTYSFDDNTKSAALNVSRKGNEALQNFSNFWIPLVLIVIAGAIVALIFGMFMAARR